MAFHGRSLFPNNNSDSHVKRNLSAEEVLEAARYIGIDPIVESQFLWIAEEMLCAPLPDGFTEHTDDEGNIYFYSAKTGQSMWEHPLYEFSVNLYHRLKSAGGEQTLNAADDFYESRLKRRMLQAWKTYLSGILRERHKQMMVARYFQGNLLFVMFDRWKKHLITKKKEKRKDNLV